MDRIRFVLGQSQFSMQQIGSGLEVRLISDGKQHTKQRYMYTVYNVHVVGREKERGKLEDVCRRRRERSRFCVYSMTLYIYTCKCI